MIFTPSPPTATYNMIFGFSTNDLLITLVVASIKRYTAIDQMVKRLITAPMISTLWNPKEFLLLDFFFE